MSHITSVLVVDDERVIAESLAAILRSRGYKAHVAHDGHQALAVADECQPDALISDVMMPGMNGIELSLVFERDFPNCKVLLMSGHVETAALLAASEKRGHFHRVLPKPVHPTEILEFLAGV